MKNAKLFFAVLIALLTAHYSDAQVSLKIKLSSPEHGVQEFTYDLPVPVEPVATPTASHAAGVVDIGTEVTLSCATEGATIHYTLDGSTPDSNSDEYTTPIIISGFVTIKAIAVKAGMDNSEVLTVAYKIGRAATPTASHAAGIVDIGTEITLSCATEGATIHYTLDGSTPTSTSDKYTTPIIISGSVTIKAIAIKAGMDNSLVLTVAYQTGQVAMPSESIVQGVGGIDKKVVLSCATDGATIHYTLDGSTPTPSSEIYTTPIIISKTVTIKAIAVKAGMHNSELLTVEVEYSVADITQTVNGVTFTMKVVFGGTFTMGCTGEQGGDCYGPELSVHPVTLSSYYIGESEVTQALWQAVMGSNPSYFTSGGLTLPVETVSWEDIVGTNGSAVGYTVNGVTYYQNGFCYKLSQLVGGGKWFRLPTEAEWEYAARGGNKAASQTKYSGSNNINDVAWHSENSGSTTHAVKTKQANALDLYDMSGNVYEWCSDWFSNLYGGEYSGEAQTNPIGADGADSRVTRGGSGESNVKECRVSFRSYNIPDGRYRSVGFRLAL